MFFNFYPNQNKLTSTKINQSAAKTNILAVILHNRIDISEPNSETHVSRLPEEISPKICAILLERGIGDAQNVARIVDSQPKPATVLSE